MSTTELIVSVSYPDPKRSDRKLHDSFAVRSIGGKVCRQVDDDWMMVNKHHRNCTTCGRNVQEFCGVFDAGEVYHYHCIPGSGHRSQTTFRK